MVGQKEHRMSKEIYISSTPHETRLAIVENDALTEIYYERENEYTLAGSIYNGKVTRVLPGMQSSFVDIGLERDAFLYITDFMEEAGDSADFDTNGNGDSSRRRNSSVPVIEGTVVTDQAADSGNRTDRNGRGDRGHDGSGDPVLPYRLPLDHQGRRAEGRAGGDLRGGGHVELLFLGGRRVRPAHTPSTNGRVRIRQVREKKMS